jgi:hypothetical protein
MHNFILQGSLYTIYESTCKTKCTWKMYVDKILYIVDS